MLPIHLQCAHNTLQQVGTIGHPLGDLIVQADHESRLPPVAGGIGFHGVEHSRQGPVAPLARVAEGFQGNWVALLGHDGAIGAVLQRQAGNPHLPHIPQQQALRHTSHVLDENAHGTARFVGEVQAGGRIHRVDQQAIKSKEFCHPLPVDGETRGGDGGPAHGAQVSVVVGCQQAFQIPGKVLHGTQIEMPQCYRLCVLGMVGVAGDDGSFVHFGLPQQRIHQEGHRLTHIQQGLSGVHALDGQVHVVAGAAGVELSAHLQADLLNEPLLQVGKEIG